ncbi:MAG: TonB-dependent receptor [Acidobacteriota bacterium]
MTLYSRASTLVVVLLGTWWPAALSAQTPQRPVLREQIEVVATRLPLSPHDVAAGVEVVSGDTLRSLGATNLREAIALAAGVEVAPGGDSGPASAVPEFWGLREFDAFLLVVDDIPWGGAFNPALTALSLHDVERVEILRGAAAVTYGASSFVGVIHVVHKAAAANSKYLSVRVGSFGSGGGAVDFGLPAVGAWKSRLSFDGERQGFKDEHTSFGRGHALYRGSMASDTQKTWVLADLNVLKQSPASPHPRQGQGLSAAVPLDSNYNPDGARLDDTRITVALGHERAVMGDARWSVTGSYTHSAQDIFRGFLTDLANTPGNASGFAEKIDVNDLYVDTHVTWPSRAHVQFIAGADLLFANGEAKGATFSYTVPLSATTQTSVTEPATLNLDSGSRRSYFGGYALAEFTPHPRLRISTGLRLNATVERRGEGENVTHTRPAGSAGVVLTAWDHGVDHLNVFADYRNTFKPAAFDFSLAENEGVLDPETADSIEGGVKLRLAHGRVDVEASGFRMDFQNLVTATVVNNLPALLNAGTTRFQGVETAADLTLPQHVNARLTYSFHDGKFTDFVTAFDGVPTQLKGNRFEMSARHLFTAGLIVAPESGVVASAVVKYAGDRYLNKRNTALAPSFTTIDLGVGYRWKQYELRSDGRNLGDRRDPVAESEFGDAQYYRMTARRVDVTLAMRF